MKAAFSLPLQCLISTSTSHDGLAACHIPLSSAPRESFSAHFPPVMYFLQTTGLSWVNYICPLLKLVRTSLTHPLFPGHTGGIGQDVPIPLENGIKVGQLQKGH